MTELRLEPFEESDIGTVTKIMKDAFDRDAQIHLGKKEGGPPGYDDGSFLRQYALHPKSESFKIMLNNELIGGIIVWIIPDNINYLGTVFIKSSLQDQGIGLRLWKIIEAKYPATKEWRTETPGFSKRNHNFYVNKCGFSIVQIKEHGDPEKESYVLRKIMK